MAVYPSDYPDPVVVRVQPGLLHRAAWQRAEDSGGKAGKVPGIKADAGHAGSEPRRSDDVVYFALRPVWVAMQAAGFYPMQRMCRGERGKEPSPWLGVSALQYAVVLAGTVTSYATVMERARGADFDGIVIEYLVYIQCALPVAILPLYALQRRALGQYLRDWNALQVEFIGESGRALSSMRGFSSRESIEMLAIAALWLVVETCALLPLQPAVVVAALIHSTFVSGLLAVSWYLHGRLLRATARCLADHLAKVLSQPSPSPHAVDATRLLVLHLLSLSAGPAGLGSALTLPLGLLLLLHFGLQTLTLYALFGQLSYGTRATARLPFLVVGVVFSGAVLYLCCDTGHRVARAVKAGVMQEILAFRKRTLLIGQDLHNMIETFIATVQEVPGDVTLSGVTTVNRQLFTAILSTMVTYLVVIVQFRVSLVSLQGLQEADEAQQSSRMSTVPTVFVTPTSDPAQ